MSGFEGVQRDKKFEGELTRRTEIEVKVKKLKNGKAVDKDEVTGKMIKGGGDRVVNWIWKLYNMAFENDIVLEAEVYYNCSIVQE